MKIPCLSLVGFLFVMTCGSPRHVGAQETRGGEVTLEEIFEKRHGRSDLPGRLREISGLAVTDDGALWAHNDERGAVYQTDPETGEVLQERVLGPPRVGGDFEGLAWDGARFHLVTSTGTLVSFFPGDERNVRSYATQQTVAGALCEVEGLALDPTDGSLVMACKEVFSPPNRGQTLLLRVNPPVAGGEASNDPLPVQAALVLSEAALESAGLPAPLKLTGVTIHPERGTWVLVAGPQERVVEVSRDGIVLDWVNLKSGRHPQPEGIAFSISGSWLYVADEGSGRDGRVTVYRTDRNPGSG